MKTEVAPGSTTESPGSRGPEAAPKYLPMRIRFGIRHSRGPARVWRQASTAYTEFAHDYIVVMTSRIGWTPERPDGASFRAEEEGRYLLAETDPQGRTAVL